MRKLRTLKAWTHGKELATAAYRVSMQPPLDRHYGLADQIRRASASIPANIVEGYALATRPQLVRCLRIALGSTAELQWHLDLARDMQLIPAAEAGRLQLMADELISILVGLLRKLSRQL